MLKEVITITFGDAAENNIGMQQIGEKLQKGLSYENLLHAKQYFEKLGVKGEIIQLHNLISQEQLPQDLEHPQAYILVVKQGLKSLLAKEKHSVQDLHKQLKMFQWDTKYFDTRRQKVLNKLARHNVCFGQTAQICDYANKKGTIISWSDIPLLTFVKSQLNPIFKTTIEFVGQGNFYHDGGIKSSGLGYHGDSQRRVVVAIRTGNNTMPLHYQWFYKTKPVGKNFNVDIAPGDFYAMSEKAVGTDWKKKNILTIRHASGAKKFVKI